MNADNFLKQYLGILAEVDQLEKELKILYSTSYEFGTDGVQASSKCEPFSKRNIIISGYSRSASSQRDIDKLSKIYEDKLKVACETREGIEKLLDRIDDARLRVIIRYKCIDSLEWKEIADILYKSDHKSTENSVKQYYCREIKKFANVTHVTCQ